VALACEVQARISFQPMNVHLSDTAPHPSTTSPIPGENKADFSQPRDLQIEVSPPGFRLATHDSGLGGSAKSLLSPAPKNSVCGGGRAERRRGASLPPAPSAPIEPPSGTRNFNDEEEHARTKGMSKARRFIPVSFARVLRERMQTTGNGTMSARGTQAARSGTVGQRT